jgi:hypothetical protein
MIVMGQAFLWSEHVSLRTLGRAGRALSESGHEELPSPGMSAGSEETK